MPPSLTGWVIPSLGHGCRSGPSQGTVRLGRAGVAHLQLARRGTSACSSARAHRGLRAPSRLEPGRRQELPRHRRHACLLPGLRPSPTSPAGSRPGSQSDLRHSSRLAAPHELTEALDRRADPNPAADRAPETQSSRVPSSAVLCPVLAHTGGLQHTERTEPRSRSPMTSSLRLRRRQSLGRRPSIHESLSARGRRDALPYLGFSKNPKPSVSARLGLTATHHPAGRNSIPGWKSCRPRVGASAVDPGRVHHGRHA